MMFYIRGLFSTRVLKTSLQFGFRVKSLSGLTTLEPGWVSLSPPLFPFTYLPPSETSFDPRRWKRKELFILSLPDLISQKMDFSPDNSSSKNEVPIWIYFYREWRSRNSTFKTRDKTGFFFFRKLAPFPSNDFFQYC